MSVIKGRKLKENNPNEECRLYKRNLRFNYGDYKSMSCINIFKPSARQTSMGIIWEDFVCKRFSSVETENSNQDCAEPEPSKASGKRKSSNLTPEQNSPVNCKNLRVHSPVLKINK